MIERDNGLLVFLIRLCSAQKPQDEINHYRYYFGSPHFWQKRRFIRRLISLAPLLVGSGRTSPLSSIGRRSSALWMEKPTSRVAHPFGRIEINSFPACLPSRRARHRSCHPERSVCHPEQSILSSRAKPRDPYSHHRPVRLSWKSGRARDPTLTTGPSRRFPQTKNKSR